MSKFLIFTVFLCSLCSGFPVTDVPDPDFNDFEIPKTLEELDPATVVQLFIQFEGAYNKEYRSPLEQAKARAVFGNNVAKIIQLNQKYADQNLEFGINYYTDFSDIEFSEKVANLHVDDVKNNEESSEISEKSENFPKSFDWRDRKNTVGGISNQGYCGCSWGETVAAMVQSTFSIKNSTFLNPSQQQLCDCSQGGNDGCGGGSVEKGLEYVMENGVVLEKNYQRNVEEVVDYCDDNQDTLKVSNYKFVSPPTALTIQKTLLENGPIGVGFKVSNSFRHYKSGIFNLKDCEDKDNFIGWHSVTVVGYGISEDNHQFWIAKNSWSPSFGEDGFFRISKNSDLCEIESKMPVFVEF